MMISGRAQAGTSYSSADHGRRSCCAFVQVTAVLIVLILLVRACVPYSLMSIGILRPRRLSTSCTVYSSPTIDRDDNLHDK